MGEALKTLVFQLPTQPWTLATCASCEHRDRLASFWLAAPEDLVPGLWASSVGDVTKTLIQALSKETTFTSEQINFRNSIGERLSAGLDSPGAIQLLIANFLYSPPGLMTIARADSQLPEWLLQDYKNIYEQNTPDKLDQSSIQDSLESPATELPQPDFGTFPDTLQELVGNRVQLNRLLGLSNLYYIDPEDQEILNELRQVRSSLNDAILKCPEEQLQAIWSTDFGDRYWSLIRSGIQKEPLTPAEEQMKYSVTTKLSPASGGGFDKPGALNAVLIAMTLFEPGTMHINHAEKQLPDWLLPSYQQIFVADLKQQNS